MQALQELIDRLNIQKHAAGHYRLRADIIRGELILSLGMPDGCSDIAKGNEAFMASYILNLIFAARM